MTKVYLSQQTYYCHDKTFVMTNICHSKHNFVATSLLLSWQTHVMKKYACHNNKIVMTNTCLTRQIFVTTKIFCRNKHNFVRTNILSWQAIRHTVVFVAAKMILVAVPASGNSLLLTESTRGQRVLSVRWNLWSQHSLLLTKRTRWQCVLTRFCLATGSPRIRLRNLLTSPRNFSSTRA